MMDHRLVPDPAQVSIQTPAQITANHVDLLRRPEGPRDRQLIFGDTVVELNRTGGWSYVQADKDSYCGYVPTASLGSPTAATHTLFARASHLYEDANIKSPKLACLTFGSRLTGVSQASDFLETPQGFVPLQHVRAISDAATDPAAVATIFLGAPYLWGGNTQSGIDCSGLVQAALLACHVSCPGDSDQQCASLGTALPKDAAFQRNDLLFWKGHVAIATDGKTMIHANAGHMATTFEPIKAAIARIKQNGDGDVIAHKRL